MTGGRTRAVVTGAGAVSALGPDAASFWEGVLAARCAVAPVAELEAARLDPRHAAAVAGYPAPPAGAPAELERASAFAVLAAREALADAGLAARGGSESGLGGTGAEIDPARLGVVLGTTLGGYRRIARAIEAEAPLARGAFPAAGYEGPAVAVARLAGARGPCHTVSIACCSGVAAIGDAIRLVEEGACDAVLAGGADALSRFVYSGFVALKALAAGPSRPFAAARDGLNLGEGACVLVVESEARARGRGARVRARLLGYGTAGDANHMTGPHPDGLGAARGMSAALADAGLGPGEVAAVNLHGTGTSYNDRMEARAMALVFGPRAAAVPVDSIKPCIGHTMGAAGAFEALLGVRVLETGLLPPTPNTTAVDPECAPLDVVLGAPRPLGPGVFLTTNSGFGGTNAALVLGRAG